MKKLILLISIILIVVCGCGRGKRVGAVCKDGWRSSATGSGACSHHGGVDHWVYKKDN